MKEEGKKLIQSVIYVLMGLQTVLGIIWIFENFTAVPLFEESAELIAMSKTLCVDEYTGILYPLFIRGVFAVGELLGTAGCSLLYVVQLAMAGFAYWYFVRKVAGCMGEKAWFGVSFIITIPCIVQCHMAVLPYSLASSVFVILLTEVITWWCREHQISGKQVFRVGALWIMSGLLLPDYGIFSGMAVGISALVYMIRSRKVVWQLLCVCLVSLLCISTLEAVVQKEGAMGKIQKTVSSALLMRCVWPNFVTFRDFWSEEVNALWDIEKMSSLAMYPEKVIYEFGPVIEQAYGREQANEIYLEMAKAAFGVDTKNIVLHTAEDVAAYICPPMTMLLQLNGVGESYTGWNYARMKDNAPMFTGYYVKYALYAWPVILLLGMGLWLSERNIRRKFTDIHKSKRVLLVCIMSSTIINFWYVMCSGNMQDYKKLMVNSVLWTFLLVRFACVPSIDK